MTGNCVCLCSAHVAHPRTHGTCLLSEPGCAGRCRVALLCLLLIWLPRLDPNRVLRPRLVGEHLGAEQKTLWKLTTVQEKDSGQVYVLSWRSSLKKRKKTQKSPSKPLHLYFLRSCLYEGRFQIPLPTIRHEARAFPTRWHYCLMHRKSRFWLHLQFWKLIAKVRFASNCINVTDPSSTNRCQMESKVAAW